MLRRCGVTKGLRLRSKLGIRLPEPALSSSSSNCNTNTHTLVRWSDLYSICSFNYQQPISEYCKSHPWKKKKNNNLMKGKKMGGSTLLFTQKRNFWWNMFRYQVFTEWMAGWYSCYEYPFGRIRITKN